MTISLLEALIAGALLGQDEPVCRVPPSEPPRPVDTSWERDFPITMQLCRAAARGDSAAVAAEVRGRDPRALLANAVGVLVAVATVEVANGVAEDVEGIFRMWTAWNGVGV